jgi:hypothetical protein
MIYLFSNKLIFAGLIKPVGFFAVYIHDMVKYH